VKSELKEFYEKKSLSTDKMEDLLALQSELKEKRKLKRLPFFAGLIAASLVIFALLQFDGSPLDQKIMKEVVYNHNKDMPSEVLTKEYSIINEALDKLDFKVIKSQRLASRYQLIGGRYCSIQGKIAAQLKMIDKKTQKRVTLYQFKPNFDAISFEGQLGAISVEIWHEGSSSFALAK
jgi:anti-sigma factor RsiW